MRCTVANHASGIVGCGSSLEEAQADFDRALVEYREVLESEPELSSSLAALLAKLKAGKVTATLWTSATGAPVFRDGWSKK